MQQTHPSWSAAQIQTKAKAEFEAAGTAMFVAALKHASAMRPKALWGFYGMPGGSFQPTPANKARALADAKKMLPVWQASGALFPSIYMSEVPTTEAERQFRVNATTEIGVATAVMVAGGAGKPRIPVYPFAWECCKGMPCSQSIAIAD